MVTAMKLAPLMTTAEVAEQLNLRLPVDVLRLIAKGHLRGLLAADGEWKVSSTDLEKYASKGLIDVAPRPYEGNDSWLRDRHTRSVAHQFEEAVKAEMARAWPEQVRELKPGESVVLLKATRNSVVSSLMNAPISNSQFDKLDDTARFKTALGAYAAVETRIEAEKILRKIPSKGGLAAQRLIDKLFESPDVFTDVSQRAVAQFLTRSISIEKSYPPIKGSRYQVYRTARMTLKNSDLISNPYIDTIIENAF